MDGKEGFDMAKMAITALIVVLVISAILGMAYLAYSWYNSGVEKLGDQVTSIDKSAYSRYDDVECTGTDVASALKTYRDTDIAVFVCNKANGGYTDGQSAVTAYAYCAMPEGWTAGTSGTLDYTEDEGGYNFGGYSLDSSNQIVHNTNFSPCSTKSSSDTYIKGGAKFYSKIVVDNTTGEIGGIVFMQMN